jgi:acetylornithine/succinyldiaminopimelate/putrescine aminotransferase
MMGLELADGLCGPLLTKTAYDQGLLLIFAANDPSVSQLLPPLIITPAEVAEVLARLDRALEAAAGLRAQFP